MSTQNDLAKHFASLHKPGDPILVVNVWDAATATAASANHSTKAIATASFAIAASRGVKDEDLSLEDNLRAIKNISSALRDPENNDGTNPVLRLPLTADLQDGYADIESSIASVIAMGVVGANVEDTSSETGKLRSVDEAVETIKKAKKSAAANDVPDFVINARTDTLLAGGDVEDAIERGKAFLQAGATTVFVWGGPNRGMRDQEVKAVADGLSGLVNVKMKVSGEGRLGVNELKEIGIARISFGPGFFQVAMEAFKNEVESALRV